MRMRSTLGYFAVSLAAVACGAADQAPQDGNGDVASTTSVASTDSRASELAFGHRPPPLRGPADRQTRSPIKHVIVIIGENRTFDHVYATYKPKGRQQVWNLLSRHIVNEDGSPGSNYAAAHQRSAVDSDADGYQLSPGAKEVYATLPPPRTGGPTTSYFTSLEQAQQTEGENLPPEYVPMLLTGGTGLTSGDVDTRIPNVNALLPGPYPITPAIPYDAYTGDPVHRFYQMWQQLDCSAAHRTLLNPSGCRNDLFPWVEATISTGSNGKAAPSPVADREGAKSMGFYNVLNGDAPYFKYLADHYAMSDNFHQSIQGGTGANHVALGTGDAAWFSDGAGHPAVPPVLNTENPDAQPGTNNYYTQDGYSGGTYSDCADESAPGVKAVTGYLHALHVKPNCEKGHYYLLNNYAPGYFGDGTVNSGQFAIPPSGVRTIGDALLEKNISWRYYGANWNRYVADVNGTDPADNYCDICNPFQYSTSIMTNAAVRTEHLKDTTDLYQDIARGYLPAVSIIKPDGPLDGHPASSKLGLFEGFMKKVIESVKGNEALWNETAIFVTFDEGGGYWDSGYVAPIDFFGDGTRIPMIAVSPWATEGRISHHYSDHVSILKFIEKNWRLSPLTRRSRDNLPNPIAFPLNPWVPLNGPSIDDLFDLFDFGHRDSDRDDHDQG